MDHYFHNMLFFNDLFKNNLLSTYRAGPLELIKVIPFSIPNEYGKYLNRMLFAENHFTKLIF